MNVHFVKVKTRVSKWGLETRKSPSPSPKFGDKVTLGRGFLESLGKIRGLGELNFWGFSWTKSPKFLMFEVGTRDIFLGIIGENGDSPIFPNFWGQGNSYLNGENWGIFGLGTV